MRLLSTVVKRCFSTQTNVKPKICIVGAGPAGFYVAQHLCKKLDACEVDIFEKLPVPFGLVRFGVAPDHPEVKNVEHTFTKTAESPKVRFLGNVNFGKDISLQDLKKAYHIILLTYGAEENRKLNIPGENLANVLSARNFVGWYNGTPWDAGLKVDLTGDAVVIFGQGNVAIDVARILLTPVDELRKTDITRHALDALAASKVRTVHLIGRRGPLQAAYTIAELREMLKLGGCSTVWNPKDFEGIAELVPKLPRPKKRITELMLKSVQENKSIANDKVFKPVFFRVPLEIIGDNKVERVKLGVTKLEGDNVLKQKAVLTEATETIDCQLAITSIGYKSVAADSELPFNADQGVVDNVNFKVDKGLYASGWLSTGPTGVIVTTMTNAFSTAERILKDMNDDRLLDAAKPGYEVVNEILKKKNVQVVTWQDWLKIDQYEQSEGKKVNKPREKIVDFEKMLSVASS